MYLPHRLPFAVRLPLLLGVSSLLVLGAAGSGASQDAEESPSPWGEAQIPGQAVQDKDPSLLSAQANALIGVPQLGSYLAADGDGLTCALLDSGARVTHGDFQNDFRNRIVAVRNFTTEDGGNPSVVTDVNGHGTNATGIVAANRFHRGVAPWANLVALKVLDNTGRGTSGNFAAALQWVLDHRTEFNITVVNMSISNNRNYPSPEAYGPDVDGIRAKIQALRALNVPVVVSAGNGFALGGSQQGMGWPAIFPETVSVGATYDANVGPDPGIDGAQAFTTGPDRLTPYSQRLHPNLNSLARTDLFAPGALLTSSGAAGDKAESTYKGTSESAPMVSGVILLMQQLYQRAKGTLPTVDQLETWLRASAVPINDGDNEDDNVQNTGLNFPRVNALGALQQVVGNVAVPVSRRILNRHQQEERRELTLRQRRLRALLHAHQLRERRLLRIDLGVGGSIPVSRRALRQHQTTESRELNLRFRQQNAQLRAHQLWERRLLRQF